jgi:hypothetical protein
MWKAQTLEDKLVSTAVFAVLGQIPAVAALLLQPHEKIVRFGLVMVAHTVFVPIVMAYLYRRGRADLRVEVVCLLSVIIPMVLSLFLAFNLLLSIYAQEVVQVIGFLWLTGLVLGWGYLKYRRSQYRRATKYPQLLLQLVTLVIVFALCLTLLFFARANFEHSLVATLNLVVAWGFGIYAASIRGGHRCQLSY